MKIVHIVPSAPYNDGWGYQDNLLPKYQKKLGHNVTTITTNTMHKDGKIVKTNTADYISKDGIRIIRLARKKYCNHVLTGLNSKLNAAKYLNEIKPDFIFFHGLVSTTIFDAVNYKKKNPSCIIVQDNHLDYNIGRSSKTLKDKIVRSFYRFVNRKSIKYVTKVYGVTPWRKTFAQDYFKIPSSKTDVLIMGADDEKINFANKNDIRIGIRNKYNIKDSDFLIVTGGKIDKNKKIHNLMSACKNLDVKLLIFGQVSDDIKTEFDRLCTENKNIISIGWLPSDKVYDYFFAADLVFFPGQHSVLWEQACAAKAVCVFQKWDGMDHVNNGGNSDFVFPVDTHTLEEKIKELIYTPKYYHMKEIAQSDATDIYLYSNIAKKSLECITNKGANT